LLQLPPPLYQRRSPHGTTGGSVGTGVGGGVVSTGAGVGGGVALVGGGVGSGGGGVGSGTGADGCSSPLTT